MGVVCGVAGMALALAGAMAAEGPRLTAGVLLMAGGVVLMALGAVWKRLLASFRNWRWFYGIRRRTAQSRITVTRYRGRRRSRGERA